MNSETVHLGTLHLGDNDFTTVGVKVMADFLEGDRDLTKLYLNDNDIDAEAASDLSDALCVNSSLKFLSLGNCSLSDEGFKHILSSLSVNRSLDTLHVWKNRFSDTSAEMLLEVLENYNPVLKEMLVFGNDIEDIDEFIKVLNMQNLNVMLISNRTAKSIDFE